MAEELARPGLRAERPDEELRGFTGYLLRRAASAANPGVTHALAELGLRRLLFSALTVIVNHPGLKQGDLADALAVERPNIVKIVDELVRAGLVTRARSKRDQRAYALAPTSSGIDLQARAFRKVVRFDRTLTRGLSEQELQVFYRALSIIEANTAREDQA